MQNNKHKAANEGYDGKAYCDGILFSDGDFVMWKDEYIMHDEELGQIYVLREPADNGSGYITPIDDDNPIRGHQLVNLRYLKKVSAAYVKTANKIDDMFEQAFNLVPSVGDGVVVICYNTAEIWPSRTKAEDFYTEAMYMCEGAERDRYVNVLAEIIKGRDVCWDGVSEFIFRVERRWF